jgi:transmembrane sensor
MEKSDFDKLLERYLKGEVTDAEKTKLDAWLDVMKTHNTPNLGLTKAEEDNLFRKITSNLSTVDDVIAMAPKPGKQQRLITWSWRIAASVLVLLSLSYAVWTYIASSSTGIQPMTGNELEKIILNDGSLVWLKQGSQLRYRELQQQNLRITDFEGEALFEIAKSPDRPFVVKCGDVSLRVLGTSFRLKAASNSLDLIVLTGLVNVYSESEKINVNVEPNEHLTFAAGKLEKTAATPSSVSSITANTEYNMEFTNTSLGKIIGRLEQKFNVSVKLVNEQAADCRITANFTDHSLEQTLHMLSEIIDIDYSRKGNTITITGTGCSPGQKP